MAKMNIERSILINKKPEEVYPLVNNFDHWSAWSPWTIMEDGVKVTVSEDKKFYEWVGDITGEGNMTIIKEEENQSVDVDLMFLKPWKSKAKVGIVLKPDGEGTRVSWWMESSLPFFLFWMKKMTEAMIGMDFDRGLNMLKEFAEEGKVHSKLEYKGESNFDGCKYIGIKTNCSVDQIGNKMEQDYGQLMEFMNDKQDKMAGAPFSIYHEWDLINKKASYTACVPVTEIPEGTPSNVISGEVPATKVHSVHHHGSYKHIGNAWSSMYSRKQNKKFKINKSIDPMEVYLNSPMDTNPNELDTEIYFPTK